MTMVSMVTHKIFILKYNNNVLGNLFCYTGININISTDALNCKNILTNRRVPRHVPLSIYY